MAGPTGSGFDDDAVQRAARRLLAAAASDGAVGLSAGFAARVGARAATAPMPSSTVALGAAAWRLLPALATLVLAVAAWTGYESSRLAAAQERTLAQAVERDGGGADVVLAMLMLGGDAPAVPGSRR
jgi:hypothetical protein